MGSYGAFSGISGRQARRAALIGTLCCGILALSGCEMLPQAIKDSQAPPIVTPEEVGRLTPGMTAEEAESIIGEPPTESDAVGDGKTMMSWTNGDGSMVFVTVENGVVVEVSDTGLSKEEQ